MVHGPVFAAGPAGPEGHQQGPDTELVAVWSRTPAHAEALAAKHGTSAVASYDELLERCEAVVLTVAPQAQPDLAVAAAEAGKAVLLEKPLALDVAGAERIVSAVEKAGVGSMVVLTYRFSDAVREFLSGAATFDALGGRACFLSGAFLGGAFASSPWRQERGALLDIGPHVIDLIDAALGPVIGVKASGDPLGWVGLLLEHEGGRSSEVSMCCRAAIEPSRTEVELFGPGGALTFDARSAMGPAAFATLRAEFVEVARTGASHPCDAKRGLHLQRILAEAEAQLARP
jgi:predicted dehydrogenase